MVEGPQRTMRRIFIASAVLALIAVVEAQHCSFADRGFKQCVANYTNWVQVQLAQIKDLSIRIISKLPEPSEKGIFHPAKISLRQHHLRKREIDEPENGLRDYDAVFEARQRDDVEKSWVKFKNDVCRIIDFVIGNGSRQLAEGIRTLQHEKGVYDVRSLVCIYTSVNLINVKGGEALQKLYKTLPDNQRTRYEKAVALQLWVSALKIADIQKNLEKQVKDCYILLV